MKVQPYLAFNGNCQEALDFYCDIFNSFVVNRKFYEDKKIDTPSSYVQKLQHAEVKGPGVDFFAYDAAPDTPLSQGNQIQMSVDTDSLEEAEKIFGMLSSSGYVHHKLRECEWGHFGRCTDRFGINWLVNFNG